LLFSFIPERNIVRIKPAEYYRENSCKSCGHESANAITVKVENAVTKHDQLGDYCGEE
jgi:transcription elongation factor Elf1